MAGEEALAPPREVMMIGRGVLLQPAQSNGLKGSVTGVCYAGSGVAKTTYVTLVLLRDYAFL